MLLALILDPQSQSGKYTSRLGCPSQSVTGGSVSSLVEFERRAEGISLSETYQRPLLGREPPRLRKDSLVFRAFHFP